MNKNIWIFNHYIQPPSLGTENRHSHFAKYLTKKGYNVSLFFSSQIHNQPINLIKGHEKYKVIVEGFCKYIAIKTREYKGNGKQRILNMIDFYLGLNKIIKRHLDEFGRPDVIYASSVHPLTLVAGIKLAKKLKIPCVCEVRDLWPLTLVKMKRINENQLITRILYALERWIYKNADKLIFTMSGGSQYIIDRGWTEIVDINKVNYINNGVDLETFNKNADKFRLEVSEDKKRFVVCYTGSLGHANMVHTIIEAAEILQKNGYYEIIFEIYGDGPKKSEYEKYISKNGINNVNIRGRVDSKYIPAILRAGNINIITGKNSTLYKYGFSQNKFFTYLASGRPMISNREVHNILETTKSGIVVSPENPQALAEGILKFYNMHEVEYSNYCLNAYDLAKEYDYKELTNSLINVLFS